MNPLIKKTDNNNQEYIERTFQEYNFEIGEKKKRKGYRKFITFYGFFVNESWKEDVELNPDQ